MLVNLATDEHHRNVAECGLVEVVGHEHDSRREDLAHLDEQVVHPFAQLSVQRTERLVEQQHPTFGREGPRERDALLLATGQGRDTSPSEVSEMDQIEIASGAIGGLAPRQAGHPGREGHVAQHIEVLEEMRLLEHHRQVPALGGLLRHVPLVDRNPA